MLNTDIRSIENLCRFRHEAMAAPFDIFMVYKDAFYAGQAAQAAFEELDRIENNLSQFIENSDVARINSLTPGRPLQIGPFTFECLQISVEMCKQTNGAFDATFGSLSKSDNLFKLNEADHTIEKQADSVKIDLGGIGKGYAADKMKQLLEEWSIDTALISAGQSTVVPIGIPASISGWPVILSNPSDYSCVLTKVHLAGRVLSASGIQKGPHIIDPRSGKPANEKIAAWATAKTGAEADALSTAFMVMSVKEIKSYCEAHSDISAFLIVPAQKKGGRIRTLKFGNWGQ